MNNLEESWEKWRKRQERKQFEKWKQLELKARKEPKKRRAATEKELKAIAALNHCSLAVYDKPFVHALRGAADITERQAEWLRGLVYKYRRQLKLTDDEAKFYFEPPKILTSSFPAAS